MTSHELEVVKSHFQAARAAISAAYRLCEEAEARARGESWNDSDARWIIHRCRDTEFTLDSCLDQVQESSPVEGNRGEQEEGGAT